MNWRRHLNPLLTLSCQGFFLSFFSYPVANPFSVRGCYLQIIALSLIAGIDPKLLLTHDVPRSKESHPPKHLLTVQNAAKDQRFQVAKGKSHLVFGGKIQIFLRQGTSSFSLSGSWGTVRKCRDRLF